jgi:hypothetical protein
MGSSPLLQQAVHVSSVYVSSLVFTQDGSDSVCVSSSLLLSLIELSAAFTLSLSNKFNSGTVVTVQWSRDNGDPVSFGLMQRSLQGNQPILSVTPVENAGGARSGTASVAFNTAGCVINPFLSVLLLSIRQAGPLVCHRRTIVSVDALPIPQFSEAFVSVYLPERDPISYLRESS